MSKLKISEYHEQALASAVYPEDQRLVYPSLALVGEVGEVAEKVLNDSTNCEAIGKEIGGVLWYCAAVANDLGTTLDAIGGVDDFEEAHSVISISLLSLRLAERGADPTRHTLALACRAGMLANQVKKVIRGDATLDEKRERIVEHLRMVFVGCFFVAALHGLSLADIAQKNLDVLRSRIERGTLLGDGDNR